MAVTVIVGGEILPTPTSFMMRQGAAGQTIANGVVLQLDTLLASNGSDIVYDATADTFTLAPGRMYRLTGMMNFVDWTLTTGAASCQWRNVTGSALIGTVGSANNNTDAGTNSAGAGLCAAIITPTVSTQVRLETLNVSGTSPAVGDATLGLPWALIEVLG